MVTRLQGVALIYFCQYICMDVAGVGDAAPG